MQLIQKYIQNGILSGDPADRLLASNGDPNVLRPFVGSDGQSYINTYNKAGMQSCTLLHNTHATLRKDEWKILDDNIVKAAMERLRLVQDFKDAGLTFTIPQGMGKTVLETETLGDVNDAVISMDGLRESPDDRVENELGLLPLPITHKDFQYSTRQIMTSRNGGSPLDTTNGEMSARKVMESIEKLALGINASYTYGGGTVYGLTNYTSRMTKTLTSPTADDWTAATILTELIAMRTQARAAFHFGPYMLYVAPNWDAYLDEDYNTTSGKTVRQRLSEVSGISGIKTLDYLTGYDMVLVQMTSDIVRLVIGMDIITLQWDTKGGMQKNFKVMAIMVPQLRADFNSNTGIVHGSV